MWHCYFQGQWANDVMSGMGYMKHSSGIVYEGNWINGLPQAFATKLVFVPNQEVYYIDKEKSFNIEIQCHNDDKELIPGKYMNSYIFTKYSYVNWRRA